MKNYFVANEEDGINLMFISIFVDAWPRFANTLVQNPLDVILELKGGHLRWCPDVHLYKAMGKEVFENILNDPAYMDVMRTEVVKFSDNLTRFSNKVREEDHTKLSDKELTDRVITYNDLVLPMGSWGMLLAVMELGSGYLTHYLEELLEKKCKEVGSKEAPAAYFLKMTKGFGGVIREERESLLHIVSTGGDLREHADKFNWSHYGYEGPLMTIEDFQAELDDVEDAQKELETFASEDHVYEEGRKRTIEELKLTEE